MIPITIADRLNHLPHQRVQTPFSVWEKTYNFHLHNLFLIFVSRLKDIEPFHSKEIDTQSHFVNFCRFLYERSSRVV